MNFNLSEEQQMLVDSLDRFVDSQYGFKSRRALAATETGTSQEHWRFLADMGILGLNVPELHGGMGKGPEETFLVMRALGRGLVLEPIIPTAIVAPAILSRGGSPVQQDRWLPAIAAGTMKVALGLDEPDTHHELSDLQTRLHNGRLNGRKSVVLGGSSADRLIVVARNVAGAFVLACIDAQAAGVKVDPYPNIDGQRSAEVTLTDVALDPADVIGSDVDGLELLEWGLDHGRAALCAEAVGVMEKLFALTLDYLKSRVQFKQPIGRYQALQHRAVDMLIAVEQAHSVALQAAARVGDADLRVRQRAVSTGKAQIGRYGRFIGEQAIQMFGGMGMTDEFEAGHYFKRLLAIDLTWGDSPYHLQRYTGLNRGH